MHCAIRFASAPMLFFQWHRQDPLGANSSPQQSTGTYLCTCYIKSHAAEPNLCTLQASALSFLTTQKREKVLEIVHCTLAADRGWNESPSMTCSNLNWPAEMILMLNNFIQLTIQADILIRACKPSPVSFCQKRAYGSSSNKTSSLQKRRNSVNAWVCGFYCRNKWHRSASCSLRPENKHHDQVNHNITLMTPKNHRVVRMAERSKALCSGCSLHWRCGFKSHSWHIFCWGRQW